MFPGKRVRVAGLEIYTVNGAVRTSSERRAAIRHDGEAERASSQFDL
jgi:hypothetical protein